MASVNKVILIGNLGKDPEVRHLEGGVAVARFPLATSESYKDKSGQRVEKTEWHNIVVWRGLAEVAEKYVRKGQSVFIEGKIRTNQYQDKDGNQRYSTEIVADSLEILSPKGSNEGGNTAEQQSAALHQSSTHQTGKTSAPAGVAQNDEPDDLPF
ncbi:single-stranded DNA-binding protein [Pontibacter fetidus]|uniref:Single-stranded DNA-binding protein n=1 Tax=Pontibacter fetidus TaxID=2700082 RepID=A0A6B2H4K7_9BACT|nr:single-stranded DNA-binding protein [Pontibacter fetidus]NDK54700.1 single-stranded DNA-binding protein [Pontibacter fetidus]